MSTPWHNLEKNTLFCNSSWFFRKCKKLISQLRLFLSYCSFKNLRIWLVEKKLIMPDHNQLIRIGWEHFWAIYQNQELPCIYMGWVCNKTKFTKTLQKLSFKIISNKFKWQNVRWSCSQPDNQAERWPDRQKTEISQNHRTTGWSNKPRRQWLFLKRMFRLKP